MLLLSGYAEVDVIVFREAVIAYGYIAPCLIVLSLFWRYGVCQTL